MLLGATVDECVSATNNLAGAISISRTETKAEAAHVHVEFKCKHRKLAQE